MKFSNQFVCLHCLFISVPFISGRGAGKTCQTNTEYYSTALWEENIINDTNIFAVTFTQNILPWKFFNQWEDIIF